MTMCNFFWKIKTLKWKLYCVLILPRRDDGWRWCIFTVDDNENSTECLYSALAPAGFWSFCRFSVFCLNLSLFRYLPSDGSDLDTVSHGSLDSANDSAERVSIDTDFTKMDSSDDGFSTGRKPRLCFFLLQTISVSLLLLVSQLLSGKKFNFNLI